MSEAAHLRPVVLLYRTGELRDRANDLWLLLQMYPQLWPLTFEARASLKFTVATLTMILDEDDKRDQQA